MYGRVCFGPVVKFNLRVESSKRRKDIYVNLNERIRIRVKAKYIKKPGPRSKS